MSASPGERRREHAGAGPAIEKLAAAKGDLLHPFYRLLHGWDRKGADVLCVVCRTDASGPPESAVSIIAVQRPAAGFVFEHAIDSLGHRAHLLPQFRFDDVFAPRANLVGEEGGGFALTTASFTGAAALVGILGVALMRAVFNFVLHFARTERRGGLHPIIEHQAVGFALADAKTIIEATRCLTWRACHAVDERSPAAGELAIQAKVFGSEMAVRVITDLMRVVDVDSYDRECHLGGLLQDALALPIFGGAAQFQDAFARFLPQEPNIRTFKPGRERT